ncbi:hypothetical protein DY000_02040278 [Brassica cretica]|uniref:Uncharacterized protein n=1 Tax=Brassica cretica TaxID=69181 RepID=A0ABQ7B8E6_BRACR|nr:hypothetical protein DY000_02040278 [Brassica cretica]
MKSKPDLALDSSSIGGRVRSKKQRLGVGPSKSMDSSGSSLDLTAEVENLSREVIDLAPPSVEVGEFPPVGPPSLIGVDEVANWRAKLTRSQCMKGFSNWALEIEFLRWWRRCQRHWRSPLVLHSYAITQLNGSEWRYHLHPRGGELPVQEIVKKNRKRVPDFDGRWTEKFAFMYLPGFSPVWCTAEIPSVDPSLGEKTITQVLELPIERCQVPFLVSKEALERCSIRGNMSGSKGEEALAEYKRALEVMSVKKAAPKKATPSENDDEVQFIKSNKRQAATALASSSKRKSRASGSTLRVSPTSSNDLATVLASLNTKVFPLTPVILPEGDYLASIQLIHGDLLQAMSQMFHLEKNNVLAREKEIKALKLRVRNQDEAGALAAAENVSLKEQLEQREEENGAIVVARWELMKEWFNHQTDNWDLEGALKQYKMVKTSEAEFQRLLASTFEGEPSIPSGAETEKTTEPVADDPPAS